MPLFLSSEEYRNCSHDVALVAEKADAFIRELMNQLETVKAEADAASVTADQTCSLLEHKYVSLSSDFSTLQSQHSQLNASLKERLAEITELRAENNRIHLLSIGKDGDIERLSAEASELHKSKRQLIELLEQKELEISEKNSILKSYLDKIVNLTENAASKEARVSYLETELARSQASYNRIREEKELIERHNSWLSDELNVKVDDLIELRKAHSELEADMSAKLVDAEKKWNETSSSLKWNKDRVRELESKLAVLEQELLSGKDLAATTEKQFSSEISTLTKLVELYKESADEWSKKAGELEGVVKALEAHLVQVEDGYKQRLENEASVRKEIEKEADCLKEKFEKRVADLESFKRKDELNPFPLSSFTSELWVDPTVATDTIDEGRVLLPSIPVGVSGTALAASLLRDGWSLAQLYTKYQEAVDALRHEQLGRKQSQAILERVLHEIEEKAGVILDEREEHERLVEAYSSLDQKLQHSLSEQTALQSHIQELKADSRRHEREYAAAQKEVVDLQKQVSVLLKECRDMQLRGGSVRHDYGDKFIIGSDASTEDVYNADDVVPEQLLAFKDISGLVDQNVQLRRLVHSLSEHIGSRETELKDEYEKELKKHIDEAGSKVNAVLARAEEQAHMIESLHTSVAMYKRLYEEAHKPHSPDALLQEAAPVERGKDAMGLIDDSHESLKAKEKAHEKVKFLDEELGKSRSEIILMRSERDKLALEAKLAREKLEMFIVEFEHQRDEHNRLLARNVEFSQLIIDYQRKLRESSDSQRAAEELSRKLTMEVSLVKQEKEMLSNSERRAADEIRNLSERAHRLQASLNTIESTEEVREEARSTERKNQELYIKRIEREWAEAKKDLNDERDRVRNLTLAHESSLNNALKQVEEFGKELSKALHSLAEAEARASIAEARCSELEEKMKRAHMEAAEKGGNGGLNSTADNEVALDLHSAEQEVASLREEARINKDHMLQYKGIAQVSEEALKQLEVAHENSKAEAENFKKSLEAELQYLRQRITELEEECNLKNKEVEFVTVRKEEALAAALSEIACLKDDFSVKMSQVAALESQISSLKDDLEKERQKSRAAQANYERQVILQSDTIQELTRTSQAVATLEEEASMLRKLSDTLKTENNELKVKWETEKSVLEVLKNDANAKYNEVNELNKVLHCKLEALHIKLAEKDRHTSGVSRGSSHDSLDDDDGLGHVVNYLRRSKEIAETEISLLKQERLRLQLQLETALKAAESAQASLNAERVNSKAFLFTEEEFKSLQLQVREINLLRESNIQLREENRHNFEECQKLREALQKTRIEIEIRERGLEERQNEVDACRREIEKQIIEKEGLKQKVDELLVRSKNFDVEDYDRLRESVQQMQVHLREKEAQLEEMKVLLSERQSKISCLEQDLSRSRIEKNEKESRINELSQVEASLGLDIEKQRKMVVVLKKKSETLSKEKEDLSKDNQLLSKQLDDAKQGKRDAAGEHVMKEKEKEKDTRLQILEKTMERLKEELKKEKEELKTEKARRLKTQKTISDSYETVSQHRTKLLDELEKHKQALKMLVDEVEKLKQSRGDQSEGTIEVQALSSRLLEDLATSYRLAVESFHLSAQSVSVEPGASALDPSSSLDTISAGPTMVSAMAPAMLLPPPSAANVPSVKTVFEKERKSVLMKPNLETRKTGRKLVRPRIMKPEDSQPDVVMSEVEGFDSSAKPSSSNDMENQGNLDVLASAPGRKRQSTSSTSELSEELLVTDDTGSDVAEPTLKRSRNSVTPQRGGEGLLAEGCDSQAARKLEDSSDVLPVSEEDDPDLPHGSKDLSANVDRDKGETAAKQAEELTAEVKVMQEELPNDKGDIADDGSNKLNGGLLSDVPVRHQAELEIQHIAAESESEREEGELVADIADVEGGSTSLGSPEPEFQSQHRTAPEIPLGVDDDPVDQAMTDMGDKEISPVLDDVKKGEDIISEDIGDDSCKLKDIVEPGTAEIDEVSESATTNPEQTPTTPNSADEDISVSRQDGMSVTNDTEEEKQLSPISRSSTTINLSQRAKERAPIRQGGIASSLTGRGRGRSLRGRSGRGARGRQTSGKQG